MLNPRRRLSQFQLIDDNNAKRLQCIQARCVQRAWHVINDTQGAQRMAAFGNQGGTGVEPDVRLRGHQRVVLEAAVLAGIGDDEQPCAVNRMLAKGDVLGGLLNGKPELGLEPLPLVVDE